MLKGLFGKTTGALNRIAAIWIFIMAVWVCGDIAGRTFFNYPIPGTPEFVRVAMVGLVWLAFVQGFRAKRHIRATFLLVRFPISIAFLLNMLASLLGIITFTLLCIFGWNDFWAALIVRDSESVGRVIVPTYPTRLAIVIGAGLISIQLLLDLVQQSRELVLHLKEHA